MLRVYGIKQMKQGLTLLERGIDVTPIMRELQNANDLWDAYPHRRLPESSPHKAMHDIWLRFADINAYAPINYGDMAKEHNSYWYEAIDRLPSVKAFAHILMGQMQGDRLGGMIITKLKPKSTIAPHNDYAWHDEYYDKFHLVLQGENSFIYSGADYLAAEPGDLFHLDDQQLHGVINNGDIDRIALIVCIHRDDGFRVRRI